jgi:hypothetical protein
MEVAHRHKKFKGEPKTRQQKRSIKMRGNVDKSKQNDAGYYEGMPGVTVDEYGNRVFMTFLVTPEAQHTSMIFAHPKLSKEAITKAMDSNKMIHQIVRAAAFDSALKDKTFLNWCFKALYALQFKRQARKGQRLQKKLHKNIQDV